MAEAFLRELGGPRFDVVSAGFEPQPANPLVVEAMERSGVKLANADPQPSVFELFRAGRHFHYVISVCDEETSQRCPIFPGVNQRLVWSFPDPSTFIGSHAEKLARVMQVRDAIRERIETWLKALPSKQTLREPLEPNRQTRSEHDNG